MLYVQIQITHKNKALIINYTLYIADCFQPKPKKKKKCFARVRSHILEYLKSRYANFSLRYQLSFNMMSSEFHIAIVGKLEDWFSLLNIKHFLERCVGPLVTLYSGLQFWEM